jgi:hypothetical protein
MQEIYDYHEKVSIIGRPLILVILQKFIVVHYIKSINLTQMDKSKIRRLGEVKEEKIEMTPFYVEGDQLGGDIKGSMK